MLLRIDHIDFKVKDMEAFVNDLLKIGMVEKRRSPAPRLSVELALPGENQVVFEVHQLKEGAGQEIHHIAFKSDGNDLERLKRNGFSFKTENLLIKDTGRTVSTFSDTNGFTWQLTD
ncbi:MAG: VOC family protein [Spirochaetia bacterium]|jgi:hypothetical protein|uniref:VOC domain-containing protein n=2 Tax=root TaxID=1 RepID=A0A652ZUW2_9SPIR|nr:VOC family protein [Spirochaetia bacterium]MDD3981555.1 hypothetical protein [Spirochaetales bacterium]NLX45858.1 VOC family protein [Treponema sp.]VBB39570.1 conserved hypothetical protein [uncultured Spirochaetota bacterium]HAP55324.1 hypothetical protein [Spirochaetaceae bacterium]